MARPTKLVVDCTTGAINEVELTDEEIAQKELDAIAIAEEKTAREAELQAQAEAKASAETKLSALGLEPSEIAAILGR